MTFEDDDLTPELADAIFTIMAAIKQQRDLLTMGSSQSVVIGVLDHRTKVTTQDILDDLSDTFPEARHIDVKMEVIH